MSSFSTRPDSDVQVVTFESAGGLNDFRNSALRDALYELVANENDPMLAVNLAKVDYLSSSGVAARSLSSMCSPSCAISSPS
jgi:anti-sigma B factor antagonist